MPRIRSIKPEFWLDRKLARRLSRDARMLYMGLWNVSDEHARCNGDELYLKGQVFPYDDDLDGPAIGRLLKELEASGCVTRYEVDDDPYLWLPKLEKHQRLEPAKVASRLPVPPPVDESAPRANVSAPHADESPLLYVAGSREQGAGDGPAPDAEPGDATESRPDVETLCNHLADRIENNGSKRPTIGKTWRDACRLLLDRDGRTPEQVRTAIDWCQDHDFWRSVVLSMPKLREKYDEMRLQAQRPANGRAGPHQSFRNPDNPAAAYGGKL